ncbi:MAG TPA: hypothetical protein VN873_18025 [Candidatus Angelobacter sp.]|nr:hypothetical protein [Candidatus Angelobacter sp.]
MKILPASRNEWLALLLLPFKIFTPAGYIMLAIERSVIGYRYDPGLFAGVVLDGYMLSFLVLALGAMIQRSTGPRKAYFSTCGFIAALFVFGWLILPYLTHT